MRSINDITPEEWDRMGRPRKESILQAEYDAHEAARLQKEVSDGSTAGYYELPNGAKELQDLISAKNMNAQIGEIFRACYRYGQVAHSPEIRDIKKILFYANAELKRLENK
jgi:hypothetical protein